MSPLQYIRAVLVLAVAPPLTIVVSALTLLDLTFFRKSPAKALVFPRIWGRLTCRLVGVRVRVEGLENIEADQTYIFAANHVSQFDIFTFQGYFPHDFRWIAKKELFRIPIFGTAMQRTGFIAMDRSHGREALKSLNKAAEQIAGGTSVIIFPEGTRSRDGRLHPFKTGTIMLAIKAGVPVVPVGINGTYAILPKGRLLAGSGEVVIRVGTPIPTADFTSHDKQKLARYLHDRVGELL